MDSWRGQGGIQLLLTAEQDAQQIVADARTLKTARLKQAMYEAETEMALYRSNMEADYQNKLSQTNSESNAIQLGKETDFKIEELKKSGSAVSRDVVAMLIGHVIAVKK